jgi:hypothetical protein
MSEFTPDWQIFIDGTEYTDVTLTNVSINGGRDSVEAQASPSFCTIELANLNNSIYNFDVNDVLQVKLKKSNGSYQSVFTGRITDFTIAVDAAGSIGYTTIASISAIGDMSKLTKAIWNATKIDKAKDGTQINQLLTTLTNITLGTIDTPGYYEMVERAAGTVTADYYSILSQIANSGLGYLYEKGDGTINYGDAYSRRDYYDTYGATDLDARHAYAVGLQTITRSGDIRNKVYINYGSNFSSQVIQENTSSIDIYGLYAQTLDLLYHDSTNATNAAILKLGVRAFPRSFFDRISFPLGNPEIGDSARDSLISIFMGLPVDISDLPSNMGGSFIGFVENYTIQGSLNNVTVSFQASPLNFSIPPQIWSDVTAGTDWTEVSATLTWLSANGVTI